MDIDILDTEEGDMGQFGDIPDDIDDDSNEGVEMNVNGDSASQDEDGIVPVPHLGMEFDSADAAKMFYEDYARRMGFSTRVGQCNRSKGGGTVTSMEFLCSGHSLKSRPGNSCEAMVRIELTIQGKWAIMKFVKDHAHSTGHGKVQCYGSKRQFDTTMKNVTEAYRGMDAVPSGVMYLSVNGNRVPAELNHGAKVPTSGSRHTVRNAGSVCYTPGQPCQKRTLGRDAQNLLDYFKKMQAENPGFYYAIQLDDDNRMTNVFWSDSRSRSAYSHFGDAVVLDTMYRVNQNKVPFVPLTGVNHHGQTILFGCALLLDESEAAFVWLFKTFLAAMNYRAPVSITTDQDRVIQAAVVRVFPEARHCISKWHVLREGQERMAHVCLLHPNFQAELYSCINMTETLDEFESFWESILDKYDLKRNDWLQSIYDARRKWVPVYFRDTFFASISPSEGLEMSFFDGYVNQQTTVPMFFRQYERALEDSFEREIEADFDTVCTTPVLRTPSPMEKQAANMYTKKIFLKFQEELVETFVYTANRIDSDGASSTYRVAKFEDDSKAYIISLNVAEMRANCSCQMFEYSGILCRHILTVFTVTNVLTLPSHYILKRWTRDAKTLLMPEDHGERPGPESVTARYNNLCKEAMSYAEEGAVASKTYNAALSSVREGLKKVHAMKRSIAKDVPPNSLISGASYADRRTSGSGPEMAPLLWPRQDEVIQQVKGNGAGIASQPASNKTGAHIAPVSLHRDGEHADNMAVLPCLKSMTWSMENKHAAPESRVAVINLKLQDYSRTLTGESEVKFSLSRVTLEPMLRSMAYISEQLSTPANKVAVINLKLQDTETTSEESEVKFQVSRDTLGAMLRSMAYIREQLSIIETKQDYPDKRRRK